MVWNPSSWGLRGARRGLCRLRRLKAPACARPPSRLRVLLRRFFIVFRSCPRCRSISSSVWSCLLRVPAPLFVWGRLVLALRASARRFAFASSSRVPARFVEGSGAPAPLALPRAGSFGALRPSRLRRQGYGESGRSLRLRFLFRLRQHQQQRSGRASAGLPAAEA